MQTRPDPDSREQTDDSRAKRSYRKPRLHEYGSLAKLTQSGGLTVAETGGGKKKFKAPCL